MMWSCLIIVIAAFWNLIVPVLTVPQGENTCQGVVKHPVKVKVNVTEPVTFRTYTWCLRVPPRCSKYVVQMKERVKEVVEMHNRTITVCCRGFVEMESKCVPACPPMTDCPNMHCNRTNHCYCSPGYSGVFCNDPCPKGSWGRDCKKPCDCPEGFTCHHLTGDCMLDDKPSVKTTVRRAFTHKSDSTPTTLKPVSTTTTKSPPHFIKFTTPTIKPSSSSPPIAVVPSTTTTTPSTTSPTSTTPSTTISPTSTTPSTTTPPSTTNIPSTTSTSTTTIPSTTTTSSTTTTTIPFRSTLILDPISTEKTIPPLVLVSPTTSKNILITTEETTKTPEKNFKITPLTTQPTTDIPIVNKPHISQTFKKGEEVSKDFLVTVPFIKSQDTLSESTVKTISYQSTNTPITTSEQNLISTKNEPFHFPDILVIPTDTVLPTNEVNTVNHESYSKPYVKVVNPTISSTFISNPPIYSLPDEITFKMSSYPPVLQKTTIKPNTRVTISTDFPGVWKPSIEKEKYLGSQSVFSKHFVTESTNTPIVPMETPNRIINPFIPAPDSTQYQSSLTIPFSINTPATDVITTEDPIGNKKIKQLKPYFVEVSSPATVLAESDEQVHSSFTLMPKIFKIQRPNPFLHSFLNPTETSNTFSLQEEKIFDKSTQPNAILNPTSLDIPFTEKTHLHNQDSLLEPISTPAFPAKIVEEITLKAENIITDSSVNLHDSESLTPPVDPMFTVNPISQAYPSKTVLSKDLPELISEVKREEVRTTPYPDVKILTTGDVYFTPVETLDKIEINPPREMVYNFSSYEPKQIEISPRPDILVTSGSELINIFSKNEFISMETQTDKYKKSIDQKSGYNLDEWMPTNNIFTSTYPQKTVPINDHQSLKIPRVDVTDSHHDVPLIINNIQTTPMTPVNKHFAINSNKMEDLSNYLPTPNEKLTTPPQSHGFDSDFKSTLHHRVTEQPSAYLPTDKDFLNLTYILNSINDFTSNSKRGMKHKHMLYGNKAKHSENPVENYLVTNPIYANKHVTKMKPSSIHPSQPFTSTDNIGDKYSKIIKLKISSPLSFYAPSTKAIKYSRNNPDTFPYKPSDYVSKSMDGKITTVSIMSTFPVLKFPSKRSTKDNLEKTENAFTPTYHIYDKKSTEDNQSKSGVNNFSKVTPSLPSNYFSLDNNSEEVSKKPFRRKFNEDLLNTNMTVALAAHSAVEEDSSINLTTGILATITCILLVGSFISLTVLFFVYCRKEKPVVMEACIMAYEESPPNASTAIYSVPRPSLLPEIFFCPTFSHHYAAQINKELHELSYGTTKKENVEPVYNEVTN